MSDYKVGDKVATVDRWGYLGLEKGDVGHIVGFSNDGDGECAFVKWEKTGKEVEFLLDYLDLVEQGVSTTYRIVGPNGQTDTFTENQVRALAVAGIVFHTETHVHDDEIVKIYKNAQDPYKVKDYRSASKSLEEQFPKDN